jgi:predicted MFS family arabinose efflux permease
MKSKGDSVWLLVAAVAGYWIAYTGWNSQPAIIQSLVVDLSIPERTAGLLTSLELLAAALTAFALAPVIGRFPLRGLCLTGALMVAVGNAGTLGFDSVAGIAAMRLITGIGAGFVLAGVNTFIASFNDPDRGYAQSNAITILATMGALAVISLLGSKFGHVAVFGSLALLCLGLTAALFLIPQRIAAGAPTAPTASGGLSGRRSYALLLAMLIWGTGNGACWAFMLQIAETTGASPGLISASISSWALAGFLGGVMVGWLSGRVNRKHALTAILILNCVNGIVLTQTDSSIVYFTTSFIQLFTVYAVMPYMLGIGADLDPGGGCAAAVAGMFMLTGATGPLAGGILVELGGYPAIGWNLSVVGIIGWLLLRYTHSKPMEA